MSTFIKNFQSPRIVVSKDSVRYRDIDLSFKKHPGTNDVAVRVDTGAIAQSIRTLVLTAPGDLEEEPDFGVGVWSLLGENYDPVSILALRDKIRGQCTKYEPRAEVTDVQIEGDQEQHQIRIRVLYYVLNVDNEEQVTITVSRVQ